VPIQTVGLEPPERPVSQFFCLSEEAKEKLKEQEEEEEEGPRALKEITVISSGRFCATALPTATFRPRTSKSRVACSANHHHHPGTLRTPRPPGQLPRRPQGPYRTSTEQLRNNY